MNALARLTPVITPLTLSQRLRLARQQNLKPPPKLNLVEWSDTRRYLSPEASSSPGLWKTSRVEAARGPMLAVSDPRVRVVTIMACTQFMKTELLLNIIGYHIDQDPAPMVVVQPGITEGEAFSKDRIDPMLRDSPALQGKVPRKRSQDGGNTVLHKQFPGGHLTIVGANAPSGLAMRPVRIVLCDEVDKYPPSAGREGDPIRLIRERAATFWNSKIVHCCSPTDGNSRINTEYEAGDQRVFEPACPHCGHREEMVWSQVKWESGHPETARYECRACEKKWSEAERLRAIKATRFLPDFGWRAKKEFKGHASFKVSKLASPWESMADLALKFVEAQKNKQMLKTFVNTQLAETWKEGGDKPEWERLYEMRETYKINSVPAGALILFAGADVQKDRIEVEITGYGRNMQSWSIDYRVFPGDTSDADSVNSPWHRLKALLNETWTHEGGAPLKLRMLAVDSSYNTQTVRRWARKFPINQVVAIRGDADFPLSIGVPKAVDVNHGGKRKTRGAKQWAVGTNLLKTELYGWLKQKRPIDTKIEGFPFGWCHFPEYPQEYFQQLTAEEVVSKLLHGYEKFQWTKTYERNEALDCRIYARAAAALCGLDRLIEAEWLELEDALGIAPAVSLPARPLQIPEAPPAPVETVGGVEIVRTKSKFWNRE
jgi:phage terminase large subunit GpA-like protein